MKCPFCNIKTVLFEDDLCFVINDNYPVTQGHCLIIPKKHSSNYFECSKDEVDSLNSLIIKTKDYLDKNYQPSGYNVGFNCGESGGQTIFHTHIHVIPRYDGDMKNPRGGVRGVIPNKQSY